MKYWATAVQRCPSLRRSLVAPQSAAVRSWHSSSSTPSSVAAVSTAWTNESATGEPVAPIVAAALAAAAAFTSVTTTTTTYCEAADSSESADNNNDNKPAVRRTVPMAPVKENAPLNPFWPSGVREEDVDALVEDCLKDTNINITSIPDYLERQLYKTTIKLTLNVIFQILSQLHGTDFLAHEIQLKRIRETGADAGQEKHLSELRSSLDEKLLEEVADRMMANKNINQSMVPDFMERQLYVNCLKIVFRLLDLISATLRVTVCGHDFSLQIEPTKNQAIRDEALQRVATGKTGPVTAVDTDLLKAYAMQAGVDMKETDGERSFFQRLFNPAREEFIAELHASLYGMILAIVDDLLNNTELELLSERIKFDIVPVPESLRGTKPALIPATPPMKKDDSSDASDGGGGFLPFASFTMGVGVGVTLMALATKKF